jgi:predicted Zn-dependent protease
LVHGKPREAIERLQKAVSLGHDTPVVRFHLVAAYEAAGMSDEARQSFNELNMDNLLSQLATPVDKSLLAHLLNQFGRVGVATGAEAL